MHTYLKIGDLKLNGIVLYTRRTGMCVESQVELKFVEDILYKAMLGLCKKTNTLGIQVKEKRKERPSLSAFLNHS